MYEAKILLDSLGPSGKRLTTWQLTYPRFVHSEFNTHRLFSRNAASSRAIPTKKLIEMIKTDPAKPVWWGKNQSGMQAKEELDPSTRVLATDAWLAARDSAVEHAQKLLDLGVHKQIVNRVLEPWMFITVIMTATELDNWFRLRAHEDAQPEIAKLAHMMQFVMSDSIPEKLETGQWHIPFLSAEDFSLSHAQQLAVSVARCARVSYLTHDGKRDIDADLKLHDKLMDSGHWSPFEHVAQATEKPSRIGNFFGWKQYRSIVDTNFVMP